MSFEKETTSTPVVCVCFIMDYTVIHIKIKYAVNVPLNWEIMKTNAYFEDCWIVDQGFPDINITLNTTIVTDSLQLPKGLTKSDVK